MKRLVLASGSPRRRELIAILGIPFEVVPSEYDEKLSNELPELLVKELSFQKCREVVDRLRREDYGDAVVIGADTIVVLGREILGKPHSSREAEEMLHMLSGMTHSVFTGVTLMETGSERRASFFEKTDVTMFDLSDEEIREYVATGEPMDKAGAYGIQGKGSLLVSGISGDYFNVVGLPVARLKHELDDFESCN